MLKISEQFAEINKAGIETAIRFSQASMDSAERLAKVQFEAAKAVLDQAGASMPKGTEFAMATAKSMMAAAASTVDGMIQAGRQLSGLAEAGVRAAVTPEAAKGAGQSPRGK